MLDPYTRAQHRMGGAGDVTDGADGRIAGGQGRIDDHTVLDAQPGRGGQPGLTNVAVGAMVDLLFQVGKPRGAGRSRPDTGEGEELSA
ncbi:hypothetical protein GCM10027176_12820 [Actinoallomurus bryophytorum]